MKQRLELVVFLAALCWLLPAATATSAGASELPPGGGDGSACQLCVPSARQHA
jgi:hypothetical protein